MVLPLHSTSSVSLVYLLPLHTSQVTQTSGRKFISSFVEPAPWHASQRPPLTLKENCPGSYPLSFASGVDAKRDLMGPNAFVYVAGLDRGVLPIGDWSMTITLSTFSIPSTESWLPGVSSVPWSSLFRIGAIVPVTKDDLPEPETPVTATMQPRGIPTSMSWRLFCLAPLTTSHLSLSGVALSSGRGMCDSPER